MQRCARSSRISGPATVGHSLDFEAAIAIQAVAMSRKRLPWFAMSMTALAVLGAGGIVFLFVYAFQLAAPPAAAALDEGPPLPPLESRGRAVFRARGCIQCHSVDGSRGIGPTLSDFWGTERPLADGGRVLADEHHFRESLREPLAKVAAGFRPSMPSFGSSIAESDVVALMAYVRSLQSDPALAQIGAAPPESTPAASEPRQADDPRMSDVR